jgi:putative tryptophan/tyrosine transport system ATP-binding protein
MIELRNLSKTFNAGSANEVVALQGVDLTIRESDFVVVVGANGSGKTTLLNIIAGTVGVDAGEIRIEGKNITALKEYERSKWIARIFQNPLQGTASELSVLENFRLASLRTRPKLLQIGTGEKFIQQVKEKISTLNLGLENKLNQPMGTLSGGQRQALSLLMAVMDETKILLMDEPTASLDPKTSELVLQIADKIIRDYKLIALFVTHQVKDALKYGDRIVLMREGIIAREIGSEEKSSLKAADLFSLYEA